MQTSNGLKNQLQEKDLRKNPFVELSESEVVQLVYRMEEVALAAGLRREPHTLKIPETTRKIIDGKMEEADAFYHDGSRAMTGKFIAGTFGTPLDITLTPTSRKYGAEIHWYGDDTDVTGLRSRASLRTTDASTRTAQGAELQAANADGIDAGVLNGAIIEALGKSDSTAATITDMRGLLVNTEWNAKDTITNLKIAHIRTHTRDSATEGYISGTGYGVYIENEAVGGNGQMLDAGIYFKGTNLSAGNKAYNYGIDFSGCEISTAEIKFQNGETIANTTDGTLAFTTGIAYFSGNAGIGAETPGSIINTGAYFKPDSSGVHLDILSGSNEAVINLRSNQDSSGAHIGGVYFTRDGGQLDAHRQIAAIQARQSGTGTVAGGELFFFTKRAGAGEGVDDARMVVKANGYVGRGTITPNAGFDNNGTTRLGDSTTNYAAFAADGELTLVGTARVYKEIWIQAEAVRAPLTNPATFVDLGISGGWEFLDNLIKVVICKLPLTTDIDRSVDATLYLGWGSPTTSAVCRWQVEYLVRAANEDMSAAAEGTLTQDETSSSAANGLVISSFTIPAAALAASDSCLLLRISRIGNHANDTLGAAANLSGVCLHHVSDSLGEPL